MKEIPAACGAGNLMVAERGCWGNKYKNGNHTLKCVEYSPDFSLGFRTLPLREIKPKKPHRLRWGVRLLALLFK